MSFRSASRLVASCTRLRAWQIGQCQALQHAPVSEQPATLASAQPSWFVPRRSLHSSAALLAVEDVVVPSMGDSITEGGNSAALRIKRSCLPGLCETTTLPVQSKHLCVHIAGGHRTDYVDTSPPAVVARPNTQMSTSGLLDVYRPQTPASLCTGTIVNVSKAAGDSVAEDEVIAQIETDKVTIDVRAPHAGTLSDILVRSQPAACNVNRSALHVHCEGRLLRDAMAICMRVADRMLCSNQMRHTGPGVCFRAPGTSMSSDRVILLVCRSRTTTMWRLVRSSPSSTQRVSSWFGVLLQTCTCQVSTTALPH